jgi:hypothetical protein
MKDDDQKFWNFLAFGFYGTDKEMVSAAPFVCIATIITLIVIVKFCI